MAFLGFFSFFFSFLLSPEAPDASESSDDDGFVSYLNKIEKKICIYYKINGKSD